MESLQPESPVANICGGGEAVTAARERLAKAGVALVERAAEAGLAADVAALCRDDPLKAEAAFRDMVLRLARSVLTDAFGALDGHGPSLEAGGGTCRRVEVTPGRAMTVFGPAGFLRSRHRPSGTGASLVPAEAALGLTACGTAPAAAGPSMHLTVGLTARESEDAWRRLCGQGPSTASLVRLSGEAGNRMEECSDEIMPGLREREEMPEGGRVAAGLARRGDDADERRDNGRKANGRRLARGVVRGRGAGRRRREHAGSRCFGRLPEAGKASLKPQPRPRRSAGWNANRT